MKTYNEFIVSVDNIAHHDFDVSRFDRIMEETEDCIIDGVEITASNISSIRRFYKETNIYNRTKITELINTSIWNIDKAHNIVLEYTKIENQRSNKCVHIKHS